MESLFTCIFVIINLHIFMLYTMNINVGSQSQIGLLLEIYPKEQRDLYLNG